ncbi:MAG TPA: hypothetical protein ENG87_05045 [Candidatus Pacearchaeota archaeon]|nr:hypothetical protein [Candidatus Pacearchaeota archaeon]
MKKETLIKSIWLIISSFGAVLELFFKAIVSVLVLYKVNTLIEMNQIQNIFLALGSLYWMTNGFLRNVYYIELKKESLLKQ